MPLEAPPKETATAELYERVRRQMTTRHRGEQSLESAHCVMGNHALGQQCTQLTMSCPATSALMNPSQADVNGNTQHKLIKVASCSDSPRSRLRSARDVTMSMHDAIA